MSSAEKSLVTLTFPGVCSPHQGMEGKGITELSGAGTAAGEQPRFSCHFEENAISFCDLQNAEVTWPSLGNQNTENTLEPSKVLHQP